MGQGTGDGAVYRFFDKEGRLLYVGSTSRRRFRARMRDHCSGLVTAWLVPWYEMHGHAGKIKQTPKSRHGRGPRPWVILGEDGGWRTVTWYCDREMALAAEMLAIETEKPYFNDRLEYWREDGTRGIRKLQHC